MEALLIKNHLVPSGTILNSKQLQLGFPFFFLILGGIAYFCDFEFTSVEKQQQYWITRVLLFNSLHVMLTYAHLIFLPEFIKVAQKRRIRWFHHLVAITSFTFISFWTYYGSDQLTSAILQKILIGVIIAYGFYHAWRQSLGISLLYNHKILQKNKNTFGFSYKEELSRKLEKISTISGTLCTTLFVILSLNKYELKNYYSQISSFGIFLVVFTLAMQSWAIYLLGASRLTVEKWIFSGRVLLRVLLPFSWICLLGSLAVHGIEYLSIDFQLRKNSNLNKRLKLYMAIVILIFIAVKSGLDFPSGVEFGQIKQKNILITLLGSFGLSLTLYHYVLDSIFYKMKDPEVRKSIAPLLGPY